MYMTYHIAVGDVVFVVTFRVCIFYANLFNILLLLHFLRLCIEVWKFVRKMSVGGEKTGISESPNCALVGKGVELVKNEFSSWRQIMRSVVALYCF